MFILFTRFFPLIIVRVFCLLPIHQHIQILCVDQLLLDYGGGLNIFDLVVIVAVPIFGILIAAVGDVMGLVFVVTNC